MKYKSSLIKACIGVLALNALFLAPTRGQVGNPLPQEVWIAVRTDGQPGSGTALDPYDGSTRAKFDAIMADDAKTPSNTVINLGPGTFKIAAAKTMGAPGGWFAKSGWVIKGSGMYDTTMQLVGSVAGIHYGISAISTPYNESRDNITVSDLTFDCNWAELGPTANTGGTVRTITNAATTSGSPTLTASGGAFTAADVGSVISGAGIPTNSFIGVINSPTSVGLSSSPVAYVPVNATATANNVTVTIAEKQIAVGAVLLYGSNNLIERCRHINTFGSTTQTVSNEEFGFVLAAPSTADATGNIIRFCRGESPAGHYGSAFAIVGWGSQGRSVTNSQIHDCVAIGTNTGTTTGFTTGAVGFGDAKNCQAYNNTLVDCLGAFYCDTGSLDGILIANNTLVRWWGGIALVADGPNVTKKNIQIIGNKLNIQNRNGGTSWGIITYGAPASNLTIDRNDISFDSGGQGPQRFGTFGCSRLVNTVISGNIADEASAAPGTVGGGYDGTNVTLCLNRTTCGAPMTGLPDNCDNPPLIPQLSHQLFLVPDLGSSKNPSPALMSRRRGWGNVTWLQG